MSAIRQLRERWRRRRERKKRLNEARSRPPGPPDVGYFGGGGICGNVRPGGPLPQTVSCRVGPGHGGQARGPDLAARLPGSPVGMVAGLRGLIRLPLPSGDACRQHFHEAFLAEGPDQASDDEGRGRPRQRCLRPAMQPSALLSKETQEHEHAGYRQHCPAEEAQTLRRRARRIPQQAPGNSS
jgi:hypothetical protein